MTLAALSTALAAELSRNEQDTTTRPVRNSTLKAMSRSPAHARWSMLNDWEQTLSMKLGRGAHSLLLGGPPVLCNPFSSVRVKDFKPWREQQHPDAIVLTKKAYDHANRINDAVRANKLACQVLFVPGTQYEETIIWEQLGRARRCTPDARTRDHLVDLKTTRDASPDRFRWDVAKMGYAEQLADYSAAMEATSGLAPRRCYIVAVESKPPYLVTVHLLTDATIKRGQKRCLELLAKLIECERTGVWPGYDGADSILDLDVPDNNMELVFDDSDEEQEEE